MKTKSELEEEYNQLKFKMGVFRITNLANNKVLIGSSHDLEAVWYAEKLDLGLGVHQNKELQKDWNHFGSVNFRYEIIEEIKQSDDAKVDYNKEVKALETLLIKEIQPFGDKGYNVKR